MDKMSRNFAEKENICADHDERITGSVIERKGDLVLVQMLENPSCSGCPMTGCAAAKDPGKPIWAKDDKGSEIGSRVIITRTGGSYLLATFLLFMMPVIILVASLYIYQSFMSYNGAILLSVATASLYFLIGRLTGLFGRAGNKWAYTVMMVLPEVDRQEK